MAVITISTTPAITVADAVVDLINAQTWTPTGGPKLDFTARRLYQAPEYTPYDTKLYVDLAIGEQTKEIADRGDRSVERTFDVVIAVQKVIANKNDLDELDALENFMGALSDFFEFEVDQGIAVGSKAIRCTDNRIAPFFNPEELDKNSRWFGLIHLTFAGWLDG